MREKFVWKKAKRVVQQESVALDVLLFEQGLQVRVSRKLGRLHLVCNAAPDLQSQSLGEVSLRKGSARWPLKSEGADTDEDR